MLNVHRVGSNVGAAFSSALDLGLTTDLLAIQKGRVLLRLPRLRLASVVGRRTGGSPVRHRVPAHLSRYELNSATKNITTNMMTNQVQNCRRRRRTSACSSSRAA